MQKGIIRSSASFAAGVFIPLLAVSLLLTDTSTSDSLSQRLAMPVLAAALSAGFGMAIGQGLGRRRMKATITFLLGVGIAVGLIVAFVVAVSGLHVANVEFAPVCAGLFVFSAALAQIGAKVSSEQVPG